jgi:undecaprenyl-diphosphatase
MASIWFYTNWALMIVLGLFVICAYKSRKAFIHSLLAGAITLLIGTVIKMLVYYPRPFVKYAVEPLIPHIADSSFPSNHAAVSFAVALSLFFYNKKIGIPALVAALALSLVRVLTMLHYATDILFGALMGVIIALIILYFEKKYKLF